MSKETLKLTDRAGSRYSDPFHCDLSSVVALNAKNFDNPSRPNGNSHSSQNLLEYGDRHLSLWCLRQWHLGLRENDFASVIYTEWKTLPNPRLLLLNIHSLPPEANYHTCSKVALLSNGLKS